MGDLEDFQGFGRRLELELDRLDVYDEADRGHVKRFITKVDGDVTEGTLVAYLTNLRKTAERVDQPVTSLSEEDFDVHLYDLRNGEAYGQGDEPGMSNNTVRNVQFAVRKFLRMVDVDGTEWAEDYDLATPESNKVTADDMLRPGDIKALTDSANNMRDVAFIEFLADTGARLSLVGSLRVGDVEFMGKKATFTPNPNASGLKGAEIMPYPIIDARGALRSYLHNTHPRPDRDDVALFHKMPGHGNSWTDDQGDLGALTPETIRTQIRTAADKADIEKPVNPHNFRHSAITRMRREGYDRSQIEHRVHWTVDTDMWATYEHIAGKEHNDAIFRDAGVVEDDGEGPAKERPPCGNCREVLAPHHDYCPRCGEAASESARQLQQSAIGSLGDGMADVQDMSRREFRSLVLSRLVDDASDLGGHDEPPSS